MLKQNKDTQSAEEQVYMHLEYLNQCIRDMKEKVAFTSLGQLFFNCILQEYQILTELNSLANI
jgi:hypothetical protein